MVNYNFSDSSRDEILDAEGEELQPPRWSIHVVIGIDTYAYLNEKQLKQVHDLFSATLSDAESILEDG